MSKAGKIASACADGTEFIYPVYIIECTSDMLPEYLNFTPIIRYDHKIMLCTSPLVSAINGRKVCVFDETNRVNEKIKSRVLLTRKYSAHSKVLN